MAVTLHFLILFFIKFPVLTCFMGMFKSVAPCKKQLIQIPPAAAIGKLALILLSPSNLQ